MSYLTPEEQKIIEKALENKNNNLSDQIKKRNNPKDTEMLVLQYLTNSDAYSDIMSNIYDLNLFPNQVLLLPILLITHFVKGMVSLIKILLSIIIDI